MITVTHGIMWIVDMMNRAILAVGVPVLVICACVMCIYITRLCIKYLKR